MKNDEPIELALRAAIAWNKADKTWATTTLDLAVKLKAARDWVGDDDTAFGQILEGNEWEDRNGKPLVSRHDRAALIKMGEFPEIAREVLATTDRRSPQYIWSHEIKPKAEPPPPPPPPPDLALRKDRPPTVQAAPPASLTVSEDERAQAQAEAQRKQAALWAAVRADQAQAAETRTDALVDRRGKLTPSGG
jgi:hypothetical protein